MDTTSQKKQPDIGSGKDVTAEFRQFFIEELKDIYGAEKALVKALPKMAENAFALRLVNAIKMHLQVTELQVQRIERIFEMLGEEADSKTCQAMKGLIEEAENIMDDTDEDLIRDAGIILAGQKIEHYEIATYGTLVAFAKTMGESDVATLLEQSLKEEKEADSTFTDIAQDFVNRKAVTEGDSDTGHAYSGYVNQWMYGNF